MVLRSPSTRTALTIAVLSAAFFSTSLPVRASDADERITTRYLNAQQLDTPNMRYAQSDRDVSMPVSSSDNEDFVSLDAVAHPRAILTGRVLENRLGDPLGRVERVVFDDYGRPVALEVDLDGYLTDFHRTVTLDGSDAYFDPNENVLRTDLSRAKVRELPHTFSD